MLYLPPAFTPEIYDPCLHCTFMCSVLFSVQSLYPEKCELAGLCSKMSARDVRGATKL